MVGVVLRKDFGIWGSGFYVCGGRVSSSDFNPIAPGSRSGIEVRVYDLNLSVILSEWHQARSIRNNTCE